MAAPDRLELLANQSALTGLDFIAVSPGQTELDLYFLRDPAAMVPAFAGTITPAQVVIYPLGRPEDRLPVLNISWPVIAGRRVARLFLPFPGGFERHVLRVESPRIDDWYDTLEFSFKVNCPTGLDCKPPDPCCGGDDRLDVAIDTTARDFWGLRAALMDFAAARWPDWQDRLAPDLGVTLAELAAALGDEFSYLLDQIAQENRFDTARERRSLIHQARLVDYEPDEGAAAQGWLTVTASAPGVIPAGTALAAPSDSGRALIFEVGSLSEAEAGKGYGVDPAVNRLPAYVFEEDPPEAPPGEPGALWPQGARAHPSCLPRGATEAWLAGHHAAALVLDDIPEDPAAPLGRWVLLRADPSDPARPAPRQILRLIAVSNQTDELNGNAPYTRITWQEDQPLAADFDLASLSLQGNLVPISAGRTARLAFATGAQPAAEPPLPRTVERMGPGGVTRHLITLPGSAESEGTPLARLGPTGAEAPELILRELRWDPLAGVWTVLRTWDYAPSLLGTNAALPEARAYTLDAGHWGPVARYWRDPAAYAGRRDPGGPARFEDGRLVHHDLLPGSAATIRFGTDDFGQCPPEGTAFEAVYRLGAGAAGNVARGTVTRWADPAAALPFVESFENPLALTAGRDPEPEDRIRRLAPALFKALTYRAVTAPDYAAAAERLDWVEAAGARFRHTGSWLALFATADPRDAASLSEDRAGALYDHLDLYRQTGRQIHVRPPLYADLDLEITLCLLPGHARGAVRAAARAALFGSCGTQGFFGPENFTFGAALYRSQLEACLARVPGVRAVLRILVRRRGVFDWQELTGPHVPARPDEIIRVAAEPAHPEWGYAVLNLEGGA